MKYASINRGRPPELFLVEEGISPETLLPREKPAGEHIDAWVPSTDLVTELLSGGLSLEELALKIVEFRLYWRDTDPTRRDFSKKFNEFIRRHIQHESKG